MKGRIEFVRPNNLPVPIGDTLGAKTIAGCLGNEMQYGRDGAEEWLGIITDVAAGRKKGGYQGTGNSHSVMVIDGLVYLECEYVETQKVLLTQNQAIDALNHYKKCLQSDYKSDWVPVEPFKVEYEAEGQEAFDRYLDTSGSLGEPV